MSFNGTERAVVVTGASSGIGRATALALAEAGWHVFAGVRRYADGEKLRASVPDRRTGGVTPLLMDVTDTATVEEAATQVARVVGDEGIAGLVNNAGIGVAWPMEAVPAAELRRQYEVNVFGQVAVTQAFLPLLRQGRGRIVNIGSIGDRLTIPFGGPLASSKWAIASITEALRLELRPWGIHVILIEPASIHTDAVDKLETDAERVLERLSDVQAALYADSYRSMIRNMVASERVGSKPDVVAEVILRALTAKRPKTRYLAGKDSRRLAFLARWAPDRLFDRLRVRMFGLPKEFGGLREPAVARAPMTKEG
ncbi:MAG TPA: SDR family oxidoreductase [Streptosporangiaceae bacterium]|jgi:NAD(P)-dependent dehydrogenase (short-subunit alcohol dehydrogenase family)